LAVQIACATHTEELLAAGCTDLPVDRLGAQFIALLSDGDAMLAGEPGGLSAADLEARRERAPRLCEMGGRLASHALSPSLVHGDFLPPNVLVTSDGAAVFFDWCEATVSHPFFSPVRFLAAASRDGAPVRAQSDLYARLRDTYLRRWSAFKPVEDLVAAFELARMLQPVHHALTYWHLQRVLAADGDLHRTWERKGVAAASLKRLLDQGELGQRI
jgi:aminoglycoside phosphotransferase (APT) family kinase protein